MSDYAFDLTCDGVASFTATSEQQVRDMLATDLDCAEIGKVGPARRDHPRPP
ncbi:hypothetical protein AB0B45_31245 [Nonomuraea sp. NPDC049152]|uniref:hypothetical protein n=1 Tax=Nonomuraea sp. NPDC049152 TaxID=3154350 RepID=UPI0033E1E8E5